MVQLNRTFNLISRDTEPYVADRHVRHSLILATRPFPPGVTVVDWGTGGGLPAIPLAIACPHLRVVAVDSVGKKVRAVQTMARRLGLNNVDAWHGRALAWPGQAPYSVSRATAPLRDLWTWHARVESEPPAPVEAPSADVWPPGLLCLKGGDLTREIADLHAAFPGLVVEQAPLRPLLPDPYFAEKVLVTVREAP